MMTINIHSRSGYQLLQFWAGQVHGLLVSLHLQALTREGLSNGYDYGKPDLAPVNEMRAALASLPPDDRREAIGTIRYLFHKERTERQTTPTSRKYVAEVREFEARNEGGAK